MKEYLLIFRDHERRWDTFSPAEMQAVIEQFDEWNRQVRAGNGFVGAGKLSSDLGVTVRKTGNKAPQSIQCRRRSLWRAAG